LKGRKNLLRVAVYWIRLAAMIRAAASFPARKCAELLVLLRISRTEQCVARRAKAMLLLDDS
jgi:hypothetical protein